MLRRPAARSPLRDGDKYWPWVEETSQPHGSTFKRLHDDGRRPLMGERSTIGVVERRIDRAMGTDGPRFQHPAPWTEQEVRETGEVFAWLNGQVQDGAITLDELRQIFAAVRAPQDAAATGREEIVVRLRSLRDHQLASLEGNFFDDDNELVPPRWR